ncbi:alpha/beta fold hydrolase [Thalassotalea piscium]
MKKRIEFTSHGHTLAGLLEYPIGPVKAYALFAHCFTCGKDIAAASRISGALVEKGFGVLRFDFTGLGNSDGDFSNTNFSSNLEDLKSAATFLAEKYRAPQLLVGHSLGGAAVLAVANDIESVSAIVTIGAPAQAEHVIKNFETSVDEINAQGVAQVKLGQQDFTIKKHFIDDLNINSQKQFSLKGKSVLLMHSPVDTVVSINEAEKIYSKLKHPKSFISLDTADHFLSDQSDAVYAATVISSWADKYIKQNEETAASAILTEKGHVVVSEKDHKFTLNVISDNHYWLADEPLAVGGQNLGPDPYEHLLAALGTCTVMTLRMYINHKKMNLQDIKVTLQHNKNYHQDCQSCEDKNSYAEQITRQIEFIGELTEEEKTKLLVIADKCPVHKTLNSKLHITTTIK